MTTDDTMGNNADAIERDIEQTQNNISDTVEALQQRLNPRALLDAVLGDEQNGSQALVAAAKRNPVAVGLIGAGALWLASGQSPSMPMRGKRDASGDDQDRKAGRSRRSWLRGERHDHHHSSYLEHMANHQPRDGEDDASYQRRRDLARADYFMLDRHHDESDANFRQRLNEAQEQFRARTATFGAKARQTKNDARDRFSQSLSTARQGTSAAYDKARTWGEDSYSRAQQGYDANPAVGGLIAAALGALVGAAIPPSEFERSKLGAMGQQARQTLAEQKDRALNKAHDLVEKIGSNDGRGDQGNRENFTGGLSPQAGMEGSGTLI